MKAMVTARRKVHARRLARSAILAAVSCVCWASVLPNAFLGIGRLSSGRDFRKVQVSRGADGYKLRYFDGRGVAETARMLFAVAGKDYEDKRYSNSFGTPGDFSTIQREEFDADKAAGKMDIAMGKVPVLEVGETVSIPQSKAIERYLAKQFGMMGSTAEEEALVDAVAESVRDINDAYNKKGLFFMKDQEKKAELQQKWYQEELPPLLEKLEKSLPGTQGFAVGDKVSLADVAIYKLLKDSYEADVSTAYESCPKLKAIAAALGKHEGLQKWITERPKTMF